jgi:hypothetical protein
MAPLDIAAFVVAWTAIYKHFDAIGYMPLEYVVYPPHDPPIPLPTSPQPDMPLYPLILELLPQLPYPSSWSCSESFELLPCVHALPYNDHEVLRWSRDPAQLYLSGFPRLGPNGILGILDEAEIVLTNQLPGGQMLVLDVVHGKVLS